MASERQIAANRRNASRSTGPSSPAGKKRAGQNAYRHGLTLRISNAVMTREIEMLARKIAGPAVDHATLEFARTAAEAEYELARVRRIRLKLIERATAPDALEHFGSHEPRDARFRNSPSGRALRELSGSAEPSATMSCTESERSAEAIRQLLPDLLKLDRYENRAAARRNRSLRDVWGKKFKVHT